MPAGRLKSFFPEKGFGFIGPDDGSKDVFAHAKQFPGADVKTLAEGMRVVYDPEYDEKRQKMQAKAWSLEAPGGGGGMPQPSFGGMPGVMPQQNFQPGFSGMPGGDRSSPYGGAPGGLPPGWEVANDPSTGKPYYFNRATNETRWEPPQAAAPVVQPMQQLPPQMMAMAPVGGSLPPGWDQAQDPGSGKTYYFNRATNETRWDPPPGAAAAAPVQQSFGGAPQQGFGGAPQQCFGGAPAPVTSSPAPAQGGPLPPGWEQAMDPASNKPYFFNRATNETRWEAPV